MPYYRSSESSCPPSAEYEYQKFDEYRRLQQRVAYRNRKFKDEVKWHTFWTPAELLARQREHNAYINRYVAEQEKIIEQKLEPLKRAHDSYRQQNMYDNIYPHARDGCDTKSSQYIHQAYLEKRRLDGRIRYRNTKFKAEVARHPEWSRQELHERMREHEVFINSYAEKERKDIERRMMEFEENQRRRAKEETKKRAEEEYRKQQKTSDEEERRQEWYQQQQQQQEDTKRRSENARARQQWWYNYFEEAKKRYESQNSQQEEHAKRYAQEQEKKSRQRASEEDRQRREKELRERQRKQEEESGRLKEQRYKSYEDGWSSGAPWKMKKSILFNDIPWPTLYHPQSANAITSEVVTAFFGDPKYFAPKHWISRKRRIHTELLRWHSDKFQIVLKNVAYSEQLAVHLAAEVVVRALNELKG